MTALKGSELEGRMREWALAWHADYVRVNPVPDWREPTDNVLEACYAHGLGDGSTEDRRRRLALLPGTERIVDRVERVAAGRESPKPAPTDAEAIALARSAIATLRASDLWEWDEVPTRIRVVRGPIASYRRPLDAGDLMLAMLRAAPEDTREVLGFVAESTYQLYASYALAEWALWPLVESALGACPLEEAFELWERGGSVSYDEDGLVIALPED